MITKRSSKYLHQYASGKKSRLAIIKDQEKDIDLLGFSFCKVCPILDFINVKV